MKKTDLAYVAGIIDGEGSINLCKHMNNIVLHVSVSNTNEWLLQWLKFGFGGSFYPADATDLRNQCWQWALSGKKAVEFLRLVYPYLQLKKPQADLAFKFQAGKTRERWRLTAGQRAVEEAQKIMMTSLNTVKKEVK